MGKTEPNPLHPAWLSKPLDKGVVECLACSHHCKIPKGKTGICGVRYNKDGQLYLLVYGRAVAYHVDPMEKKPLYHFFPGMPIFSFGTVGCNFRCLFCQNWDISQFHKENPIERIMESGVPFPPADIVGYCLENKIPAVAFTYNEPGIFFEYAYDTAKLAKEKGLKTVYVSNGFETKEALDKILPYVDAINIDLKGATEEFYVKICGGHIQPVKDNIKYLWDKGMWVEVTTLVVTGHNEDEQGLTEIAKFLAGVSPDIPWHISRYFPMYKMKEPPTSVDSLEKAYKIGKKAGLRYIYVGNIMGMNHENTYCPKCNELLIERFGYEVNDYLDKGKCPKCGEKIAGRFNE